MAKDDRQRRRGTGLSTWPGSPPLRLLGAMGPLEEPFTECHEEFYPPVSVAGGRTEEVPTHVPRDVKSACPGQGAEGLQQGQGEKR